MEIATFTVRNLGVMAYGTCGASYGFTIWCYRSPGLISDALAPRFFDNARDMFCPGDVIFIVGSDGTAQRACRVINGAVVLEAIQ